MNQDLYNTLKERGYIYQSTHDESLQRLLLSGEQLTFYLGIDPTADSLHIGHFFALMMFRYFQEAGHKGILVIGGATALIGDPSGKSDMRKMMSKETVQQNINEVRQLAMRFIKTDGENPAIICDNSEWIKGYDYIDFLRDIGIHFNVNTMLQADAYQNRIKEGGLTYLEMGYMLMQAYDFVYLNKKYNVRLQIGGSDQWGNIVAGVNLGRKMANASQEERPELFGLTCPLLMTAEGKKMGKTEAGTLWVAREKTTAFDFYQYFYNVKDEDTESLLKLFTRLPLDDIQSLLQDIRTAKKTMAYEITKLVHGEKEADAVLVTIENLFQHKGHIPTNVPSAEISEAELQTSLSVIDLLVAKTSFISSNSEARRLIQQGGLSINGNKIQDKDFIIEKNHFKQNELLIKAGKKRFLKIIIV